jgi:hypothetical protein
VVHDVIDDLRRRGFRVATPSGWEDHDARVVASTFVAADLVTGSFPEGCVQVTTRMRLRSWPGWTLGLSVAVCALVLPVAAWALAAAFGLDVARGVRRGRSGVLSAIEAGAT